MNGLRNAENSQAVVVHTFKSSNEEIKTEGSLLSLRLAWSAEQVPGQASKSQRNLALKKKKKKKK